MDTVNCLQTQLLACSHFGFFPCFYGPLCQYNQTDRCGQGPGSCELELVFVYIVCGGWSVLLVPSSQLVISSVSALLNTACSQGLAECC